LFKHFSHGSSGGSSGGSYGSDGGYYTAANNGAPAAGYYTASTVNTGAAGYYTASNTAVTAPVAETTANVGYLNITVPEDAKVYLQDQLMTVTGTQRRFVTPEIKEGTQLLYTVKVEVVHDGQTITKTTEAVVGNGQEVAVTASLDAEKKNELVTSVGSLASR
jgi:uncharacterized protein (TIGR03000 family)